MLAAMMRRIDDEFTGLKTLTLRRLFRGHFLVYSLTRPAGLGGQLHGGLRQPPAATRPPICFGLPCPSHSCGITLACDFNGPQRTKGRRLGGSRDPHVVTARVACLICRANLLLGHAKADVRKAPRSALRPGRPPPVAQAITRGRTGVGPCRGYAVFLGGAVLAVSPLKTAILATTNKFLAPTSKTHIPRRTTSPGLRKKLEAAGRALGYERVWSSQLPSMAIMRTMTNERRRFLLWRCRGSILGEPWRR